MDTVTLKQDIQLAVSILKTLEGLSPNSVKLQSYTDFLANILESDTMLALVTAWINTLAPQPAPAPTIRG